MRQIGTLQNKEQAHLLSDHLTAQGIENEVKDDDAGLWSVWIYGDNQMETAHNLMMRFLENPNDPRYRVHSGATRDYQRTREEQEKKARRQVKDIRTQWASQASSAMGPVTLTLLIISIIVSLVTSLGQKVDSFQFLFITDTLFDGDSVYWNSGLTEIMHGQIWRLFTPMFLHFGIFHIVFNMLWLKDLGGVIEKRHGSLYTLILVLVISGLSNVAQFYVSGPLFGGMSGVVYGFLGYLWIRGKYDPSYGFMLHPHIVIMMILWLVISMVGLIGGMANTVHIVGLATGMAWGYLASGHWKRRRRL